MIADTGAPSAVAGTCQGAVQAVQAAHAGDRDRREVQRGRTCRCSRDPCGGAGTGGRGQAGQTGGPSEEGIEAAGRQDLGDLRARQGPGATQTAATEACRRGLRRSRRQRAGVRDAGHRQDPRVVRHRSQACGVRPFCAVHPSIPPGAGICWPPRGIWSCHGSSGSWTTSTCL